MSSYSLSPAFPPAFRRLAWSNLAAQAAEQIGLAATPIVAVLALGAGSGVTGLLQTAQTLPFVLLALPAGLLADRMSRSHLMAAAEGLRVAALVSIMVLLVLGLLTLPLLAILGFIGACGTVAYSVAAPALVPTLVAARDLPVANGRIELARTVAYAGGPALAGVLIGWFGAAPGFAVAAALSIVAVVLLAGLREPARTVRTQARPLQDMREGARFVFTHKLLMPVLATQFVFNTAFFVMQAVFVPYAVAHLGLSSSGIGFTLAAYGVGMVIGAFAAPRILRALPFGIVVAIGPVAGLIAALMMAATIRFPSAELAAASFLLMGLGPIVWVISTTTLRQAVTPPSLLGRVSAINIAAYGSRPLGAAIGAFVGGTVNAEAALVVAALGFLWQAVIILRSPVCRLADRPEMVGERPAAAVLPPLAAAQPS